MPVLCTQASTKCSTLRCPDSRVKACSIACFTIRMTSPHGRWDPLATQRLIDDLLVGAVPVYVAMHDWCSLAEAASRLQLTVPEVIERIRDGRLSRVGKYLQRSGFVSVLVNLGHVGQEGEAVSLAVFASSEGLRTAELATPIRRMGLPFRRIRGPRGGDQLRLTATDRQAFHDRFISFRTLGGKARMDWDSLRQRLDARGIVPAGGSAGVS